MVSYNCILLGGKQVEQKARSSLAVVLGGEGMSLNDKKE
jgi:hypothetical protein